MNKQITGIVVTSNTKDLIDRAYNSVRKFHPDMKIIIVDGSDEENACYSYVRSLADENTEVVQVGYNIGHGRGMCVGIYYSTTPFVLVFDSDIEMVKSPINQMMSLMEESTFGVGYIEKTNLNGFTLSLQHNKQKFMLYLHPFFALIQVNIYKQFAPFCHHGAPCVMTMFDIYNKGLSSSILKSFPGLTSESKKSEDKYVIHDVSGTRNSRKANNLPEIEGIWETNKDNYGNPNHTHR